MVWTGKQLNEALGIEIKNSHLNYGAIKFNSKQIKEGDIFIALKGGARDGHEFIYNALDNGASLVIAENDKIQDKILQKQNIIKVQDTTKALHDLAEYKRKNSKAKFIAVTGSVGKTTTKEILKTVLGSVGKSYASEGSFNNYLGVPLTLASMPDDIDYAVIEIGMNAKGEISELVQQVKPDIAVITNIGVSHIEFFNSVEEIADAKCEIFEGLNKNKAIAVINRDVGTYNRCIKNLKNLNISDIYSFGEHQESNVKIISYKHISAGVSLCYNVSGKVIKFDMDFIPYHFAYNFSIIFLIADLLKIELTKITDVISQIKPLVGRGGIVNIEKGPKKYDIICDYYNSNPVSLKAALKYLKEMHNSKKVAIIGDMGELGEDKIKFHKSVIPDIVEAKVNKIFLVGDLMPALEEELLLNNIATYCYKNADSLKNEIYNLIENNELILIKGSRSMKLEKIAEVLGVENAL